MSRSLQSLVDEHVREVTYGMPGDHDTSDALEVIGERLHKSGDLSEVLDDLYQDGDAYVALDRLMCGRAKAFVDERVLQTLLRRLKALSADVDRELES